MDIKIVKNHYDEIAKIYDSLFTSSEDKIIEKSVIESLNVWAFDSVLDIGCGTGILFDNLEISNYQGVDSSWSMLDQFYKKHGKNQSFNVACISFEKFMSVKKYDKIISLFGAFSYIPPKYLLKVKELLSDTGEAFIMIYKQTYIPITYNRAGVNFEHYMEQDYIEFINQIGASIEYFDNYLIIRFNHENI